MQSVSILVGGGQAYYGPTAERDKKVVTIAARLLREAETPYRIQIVTGGTAGIPDDFAKGFGKGQAVDVVSSEHLPEYLERTAGRPRSYWVAGESQEKRRLAFTTNPNIAAALFVQGGQYTTHEILLMQQARLPVVVFWGSGGASGGQIPYKSESVSAPTGGERPYHSTDPDADPYTIAGALIDDLLAALPQ